MANGILYHRWENQLGEGPYQGARQVCIDRIAYDENGLISPVRMTGVRESGRAGGKETSL